MPADQQDNLLALTASQMARLLRGGDIGCEELVEAHIRQIERVNPALNAVVIPRFTEVRREAAEAQRALQTGEAAGVLHGVPITVKESYPVAGTDCTWGLRRLVGKPSPADGPLVRRARRAGALILGKTNCSTLLFGGSGNPVYGDTKNPWNLARSPGGSSSGEGAIVAAWGSPLGLGGDLGGSIRGPCHNCGIHGFKPTAGRLTNGDNPPGLGAHGRLALAAQKGPMSRAVEDLLLAMAVLVRPEGEPPEPDLPPPVPWSDPREVEVDRLQVGVYTDDGLVPPSQAIVRAVESAAGVLAADGLSVVPFTPPDPAKGTALFSGILGADGGAWIRRSLAGEAPAANLRGRLRRASLTKVERQRQVRELRRHGERQAADLVEAGGPKSVAEYWALVVRQQQYRRRFLQTMDEEGLDVLICPPSATPAGHPGSGAPGGSYLRLYNLLGMPAGVVAASRVRPEEEGARPADDPHSAAVRQLDQGSAGLPVGVQVVGRHWQDHVVLAVMARLEARLRRLPGYPERPDLA